MGLFGHPPEDLKRSSPRLLTVSRTQDIGAGLRRIVFSGDFAGFPANADAAHIKLFFKRPEQAVLTLPEMGPTGPVWPPDDLRPIVRTYTIRRYLPAAQELWVDFVLHGHGPGGCWAEAASVGETVGLAGPGGPQPFAPEGDFYLLAADPSAIPAISAVLDNLPPDAVGQAYIELAADVAEPVLPTHPRITVQLLRRAPDRPNPAGSTLLLEAVQALPWPDGRVTPIIAGESGAVVAVRDFLRSERGFTHKFYAMPYWKAGEDEETYHAERHRIMDQ